MSDSNTNTTPIDPQEQWRIPRQLVIFPATTLVVMLVPLALCALLMTVAESSRSDATATPVATAVNATTPAPHAEPITPDPAASDSTGADDTNDAPAVAKDAGSSSMAMATQQRSPRRSSNLGGGSGGTITRSNHGGEVGIAPSKHIPEALSDAQIAAMELHEARAALAEVGKARLSLPQTETEVHARLKDEAGKLQAHLMELTAAAR